MSKIDQKKLPTPQSVIDAANGGQTPSIGTVLNHWTTSAASGYGHFLTLFGWFVSFALLIGLVLVILGFVTNSSQIKRLGGGAIFVPLCAYGLEFLIPVMLSGVRGFVMPH